MVWYFDRYNLKSFSMYLTHQSFHIFQAIAYEGQDKNPEMRRVLLTHEIMCR
jgi:hypothetical protein